MKTTTVNTKKPVITDSLNQTFLRRKLTLCVSSASSSVFVESKQYAMTILKNIEPLGFVFSKELIDNLITLPPIYLQALYLEIIPVLKKMVGANVKHKPMYPNFPQQVMDASDIELYFNAILHYLGFGLPEYETEERLPLFEKTTPQVIKLGSVVEFNKMFTNLMSSKTSLSETDKDDLANWIQNYEGIERYLPSSFGTKETMAFCVKQLLGIGVSVNELSSTFKTATDILRLAVALSDGDISLATKTKFKSFIRSERKLILGLLNEVKPHMALEDMARYRNEWVRLGERLHPGEYKRQYQNVVSLFSKIRSDEKLPGFNSKVELNILKGDLGSAVELLSKRPGEFARRLDKILREAKNNVTRKGIIESFKEVASRVSSTVLLQVMSHFKNRDTYPKYRAFFPKGNLAKIQVLENTLPTIKNSSDVVKICREALISIYSEKESLGNCFLDENLKGCLVPFSQRSASKAFKTVVRGSKFDMPEGDIVRFFLWWTNMKDGGYNDRVDIDLSAVLFDTNWKLVSQCTYYNLQDYGMTHSGDITDAPGGASEFIDIDVATISQKARYLVMSINSFTGQSYNQIECFAGWMTRKEQNSGEIYEPKTVQNKIDLTADSRLALPVVFDLLERKIIWLDLSVKSKSNWFGNNVNSNLSSIIQTVRAMCDLPKANLYDLFELHIIARGGLLVDDKENADKIFSVTEGTTPFDMEEIMAEYL